MGRGSICRRGGPLYRTLPVAKLPLYPLLLLLWKFPGGCMFSIKSQRPWLQNWKTSPRMTQQYFFFSLTALHCHACFSHRERGHITGSAGGYLCKSFRLGSAVASLQFAPRTVCTDQIQLQLGAGPLWDAVKTTCSLSGIPHVFK